MNLLEITQPVPINIKYFYIRIINYIVLMLLRTIFSNKLNNIQVLFVVLLCACLVISFYIMVVTLFSKNKTHNHIFSAWQFPMLLAIFIDTIYHTGSFKKYVC
jgi:hypothetical protein